MNRRGFFRWLFGALATLIGMPIASKYATGGIVRAPRLPPIGDGGFLIPRVYIGQIYKALYFNDKEECTTERPAAVEIVPLRSESWVDSGEHRDPITVHRSGRAGINSREWWVTTVDSEAREMGRDNNRCRRESDEKNEENKDDGASGES